MHSRFPFVTAFAALLVFVASVAALAVLGGAMRYLTPGPLVGEVRLEPVLLPAGVALDPLVISQFLETALTERAERDIAVQMAFGPENSEKVKDIVIPRLVSAPVIGQMIEHIPPLKAVLALRELRTAARLTLRNTGSAPLADVAMTLPGLVLAERADGSAIEIASPADGVSALRLGTLEPGETLTALAWLSGSLSAPDAIEGSVALGAAGGVDGQLAIHAAERWVGEDLEVYGWARWLVAAILAGVALASFGLLTVLAAGALRRSRTGPARPA